MVIFDTNMILRYLLNDNEEMKNTARRYLIDDKVYVTIEVIAEVIYVQNGTLRYREYIAEFFRFSTLW